MLSQQEILNVLSTHLNQWKSEFGIIKIGLFGSYCINQQTEESDIDLIVEFENHALSFDNYMDFKIVLEDYFQKQIDLVIKDDIKPALRSTILESAKYAESA